MLRRFKDRNKTGAERTSPIPESSQWPKPINSLAGIAKKSPAMNKVVRLMMETTPLPKAPKSQYGPVVPCLKVRPQ